MDINTEAAATEEERHFEGNGRDIKREQQKSMAISRKSFSMGSRRRESSSREIEDSSPLVLPSIGTKNL